MWLLLMLACAPDNTTQDDVDELLDRIESLERQVVALGGTADLDGDGDGFRDFDGLPVGTRRGDVLFEDGCDQPGKVVTFPAWLSVPEFGYPGFYAWEQNGEPLTGDDPTWMLLTDDQALALPRRPIDCGDSEPGDQYRQRTRWRFLAR